MSSTIQTGRPRVLYWEDIIRLPIRRYGPVVFTSQLLDQLLELMGEKHPVHQSDGFAQLTSRKRRIVPGGFIHSITSGWTVKHGSCSAVVGLRSITWDFVRPIYPDEPFFFTNNVVSSSEIDERLGLVNSVRRVFDENDRVHAIGRLSVLLLRRGAARRPRTDPAEDSDEKRGEA